MRDPASSVLDADLNRGVVELLAGDADGASVSGAFVDVCDGVGGVDDEVKKYLIQFADIAVHRREGV